MDVEDMVKYRHIPTPVLLDLFGHLRVGQTYQELWDEAQDTTTRFQVRKRLLDIYVRKGGTE